MSNPIPRLTALGQSLWYDNIQRKLIENGELRALIERGDIRGVTSNPTIFNNAIAKSNDYDSALTSLAWAGWDAEKIFWQLAVEDIRAGCDLFYSLYDETNGGDGYVSLEVNPRLANDTEGTVAQAKQLWETVDRPNLMIKIPATKAGVPAVRRSIAAGINVNVTLIFSLTRYAEVMDAFISGLEDRVQSGLPVDRIASVASFFVSRVDTKVDAHLEEIIKAEGPNTEKAVSVLGSAAIANAKLAYKLFQVTFDNERFSKLRTGHSARMQRPLWASTGTKNPKYPDTLYVNELIGPYTVNTVPPQTLDAYRDHGLLEVTLTRNVELAHEQIEQIESLGISMDGVTKELEDEGVRSFMDAFTQLLDTIEVRRKAALSQLGPLAEPVMTCITRLEKENAPARLHGIDPSFWTDDPAGQKEIRIRLGWLNSPRVSLASLPGFKVFADEIYADGFTHALLLGMGGSSLAPEVMALMFAGQAKGLDLAIVDSTDPAQVLIARNRASLDKTLFIVSSKSGGTSEVNAALNYFWAETHGNGKQFIAITDPNTSLGELAANRGFRKIFIADPTVGGRYSVLTPFGIVPATLMGVDVELLLGRAIWMQNQCSASMLASRNPGLALGVVMAQAALSGRDKLTLIADKEIAPFGAWVEQLVDESSGKLGKGVVVIDEEPLGTLENYGQDRLFVYFRHNGRYDSEMSTLSADGHPVLVYPVVGPYELGAEFYRWEVATAVACAVMNVNAFDQPDVQDSKDRTKSKVAAYNQDGKLDEGKPVWSGENVRIYSPLNITGASLRDVLNLILSKAGSGDYVAINAYLPRTSQMFDVLQKMRVAVRAKTGCASTIGFGPRFLHSTGQLHKGGADNGVFIQITADPDIDLEIPTQGMTFGVLERAQALGDYESLVSRGRRIIRIHFSSLKEVGSLPSMI